jgi:uncharacterized protein
MFRGMRRKGQLLSEAETIAMLESCSSGVLAVQGDDDYPYAVPLSFAYEDGRIYFHCARTGHKLDGIERNERVSFCVIAADDVQQSTFTTHFRSAIAFGRARVLTDADEQRHGLRCLARKYSPDHLAAADAEIEGQLKRTCVMEIAVEHLTGKAAIEIVKSRAEAQDAPASPPPRHAGS